jgi:hypothetical protein
MNVTKPLAVSILKDEDLDKDGRVILFVVDFQWLNFLVERRNPLGNLEPLYSPQAHVITQGTVSYKPRSEIKRTILVDPIATLEPIKSVFLRGISAANDYLNAPPEEKRILVSELLWNLKLSMGEIKDFQFKKPYDAIANGPKPTSLALMLRD